MVLVNPERVPYVRARELKKFLALEASANLFALYSASRKGWLLCVYFERQGQSYRTALSMANSSHDPRIFKRLDTLCEHVKKEFSEADSVTLVVKAEGTLRELLHYKRCVQAVDYLRRVIYKNEVPVASEQRPPGKKKKGGYNAIRLVK